MKWINMTPGAAKALSRKIEDDPGNPNRSEVPVLSAGAATRVGRCPRLALLPQEDGSVLVGVPDDGWSETKVRAERPDVVLRGTRADAHNEEPTRERTR